MNTRLRHACSSLILGILAAGVVSAATMAILPADWRGPRTLAIVAVATIGCTILARGGRPPVR